MSRECGDCTVCCEGHIGGKIYGVELLGAPCRFLKSDEGCGIHEYRPSKCRKFFCGWILDKDIPEENKPNVTGIIPVIEKHRGIEYTIFLNARKQLSLEDKKEILRWSEKYNKNVGWQDGVREYIFIKDFDIESLVD